MDGRTKRKLKRLLAESQQVLATLDEGDEHIKQPLLVACDYLCLADTEATRQTMALKLPKEAA